jgi:hypothetical protein
MARGKARNVIGRLTQVTTIRSQTVRGPRTHQVAVRRSPQSMPQHKKSKSTATTSSHSNLTLLMSDEPILHEHLNFISDMDPPSSKVTCIVSYSFYYAHHMNCRHLKITLRSGYQKRPCIWKLFWPMKFPIPSNASCVKMTPFERLIGQLWQLPTNHMFGRTLLVCAQFNSDHM